MKSNVGARRRRTLVASVLRFVPITWLGALVLAVASAVLFRYGLPRVDYVVQLVSISCLGFVVLGMVASLIGFFAVGSMARASALDVEPLGLEARRGFVPGRAWPRLPWLPLVDVDVRAVEPSGLQIRREGPRERIEAMHRTAGATVIREYRIEDAFGLVRMTLERSVRQDVKVAPFLGNLDRSIALRALAVGDNRPHPTGRPEGDRVEMRPYVRGDPIRLVLWKTYARTGQLMVRSAERALDEETEVHAFLVAGPGDEPSSAAAWVAVTRGLLGPRWCFGADGSESVTSDPSEAALWVAQSRLARGAPAAGLAGFLNRIPSPDAARVVLFLPCQPGAWLDEVSARIEPFRGRVSAVIAHDGFRRSAPERRWLMVSDRDSEAVEAQPDSSAVQTLTTRLTRAGAGLFVIDRPSGRGSIADGRLRTAA